MTSCFRDTSFDNAIDDFEYINTSRRNTHHKQKLKNNKHGHNQIIEKQPKLGQFALKPTESN